MGDLYKTFTVVSEIVLCLKNILWINGYNFGFYLVQC